MHQETLYTDAVNLLKQLIATQSFSKEEDKTAALIEHFFNAKNIRTCRHLNNVWCVNEYFDERKPCILLNSHHDTVKPNSQYTNNPFEPSVEDGKLFGLGSNDAGGCLVSLMAVFLYYFPKKDLQYNVVFAASAEEEITGKNGIESLLQNEDFKTSFKGTENDFAIVGEPTLMNLAVAEKGLLVLDCVATGIAGHAARNEGENAIYKALKDIEWIKNYSFKHISQWLGKTVMNVTVIETENKQHNVIPAQCKFVVDIRITDAYTHEEVLQIIEENLQSEFVARSFRLRATRIDSTHPIVVAGMEIGKKMYGSPTSSDKALMPFPALKCGPGDSARSHTANEFIYLDEIKNGITDYILMLNKLL